MKIGVLKCAEESLVGVVPSVVSKLNKEGYEVIIESGAGAKAGYEDAAYQSAGATVANTTDVLAQANLLITVSGISDEVLSQIKDEQIVIGKFNTLPDTKQRLVDRHVKAHSLDLLPRSTIAQSMDVLSALASLSGYKSVLKAADHFPGYFPMMTTSAGTMPPAKVLVLGAGVAGLQAIATAKRLGAVVEAFDVRSSVKDEVQSLGAKFIEVPGSQEDASAGGYAVKQTEEYIQKQKQLIHESAVKADVIVTTAAIPGRKAPLLIETTTVEAMKHNSVIVDLAASTGGNCALTQDNAVIEKHGVTIIGNSRLYDQMAAQASLLYSNNVLSFIKFVFKEGFEGIPYDNEIVSKTLLAQKEESVFSA